MERRGRIVVAVIMAVVVVVAGIATALLFFMDEVENFYENIWEETGLGDDSNDGESQDSDAPEDPDDTLELPGEQKPSHQALGRILSSSSYREVGGETTVASSDSIFYPLIATPIAVEYRDNHVDVNPLLIEGDSARRFLDVCNTSCITIGNVDGIAGDLTFSGGEKDASLAAARNVWSHTDGALIVQRSVLGYEIGCAAVPLASYLNIPVIITDVMDGQVKDTLSSLNVQYILICGNTGGYKETYRFSSVDDALDLCTQYLSNRLGQVGYITVTNSQDVYSSHGVPGLSCLAPYLSSSHLGVVINEPLPRLDSDIFESAMEDIATPANESNGAFRTRLTSLLEDFEDLGILRDYLNRTPYLGLLGDPYSIPFHYFMNPNPSSNPNSDDEWIATDDFYADTDGDITHVELAAGRILALTASGVSAMISRSVCYGFFMPRWEAESVMNDVKQSEWEDTAYAAKGDDWNGAIWLSTSDYWMEVEYLSSHGFTVHTTQRRTTGATVSQDIMEYYSSSNIIYVMAHGSPDGYQMIDGIEASDVKNWEMGPSVQILTSCSAARTDVPDIDDTISLTFIEVGVAAYIGGTRTESSGASPILSSYVIDQMVSNNDPVGVAGMNAKNRYVGENPDRYEESSMRVLYGDPAFDPHQP